MPLIVASVFLVLLVYVWQAGRLPGAFLLGGPEEEPELEEPVEDEEG